MTPILLPHFPLSPDWRFKWIYGDCNYQQWMSWYDRHVVNNRVIGTKHHFEFIRVKEGDKP